MLWQWLIALCFVGCTSLAFIGYGLFFKRLSFKAESSWVFGVIFALILSTVCGLIPGGYTAPIQGLWLLMGLVSLGHEVFRLLHSYKKNSLDPSQDPLNVSLPLRYDWHWLLLPGLYYFNRLFLAGMPQVNHDVMALHLSAPQTWADAGRIMFEQSSPHYLQTGLWHHLYGLPLLWLDANNPLRTEITHIYAQLMHSFWAQGGCVILAATVIKHLLPSLKEHRGFRVFLGWLCTSLPSMQARGSMATADYAVALFALAAVVEYFEKRTILAGVLAGLTFAVQTNAVTFIISLFVLLSWRQWWLFILGLAVGVTPFFLRLAMNLPQPWLDLIPQWQWSFFTFKSIFWFWLVLFAKSLPRILIICGFLAALSQWTNRGRISHKPWILFLAIQAFLLLGTGVTTSEGTQALTFGILTMIFFTSFLMRESLRHPLLREYRIMGWSFLFTLGFFVEIPLRAIWMFVKSL